MNALEQSLEKLSNDLSNDFDKTKSVFEEAVTNHCSDRTKNQLFNKGLIQLKSYFVHLNDFLFSSNRMDKTSEISNERI
jgi:hypothetical protein